MTQKIFVLDTNVILHDGSCINHFQEHNLIIPIVVLEELDNFKKGHESVNYNAREFVRRLDSFDPEGLFEDGVQVEHGLGKLKIKLSKKMHPKIELNFPEQKPDHTILNTAMLTKDENPDKEVILVSKDLNLRLKARSLGIRSEDYTTDHIENPVNIYEGVRLSEDVPKGFAKELLQPPYVVPVEKAELPFEKYLKPNEYLILRNLNSSQLACYREEDKMLRLVKTQTTFGITPRNAEQSFALDALLNPDIKLVSLTGKAGTGKTLLALAAALENHKKYRQIFLARPVIPLSNKDLGFLPGTVANKLDPYMQPLYDNLSVIQNQSQKGSLKYTTISKLLRDEKLIVSPLAYIRGRSLVDIFFIVDEAQNLTPREIKAIITRAGEGTKMIFTGDIFQIDHPYLDTQSNGLSFLIDKMQGQSTYAHINLAKGERSELAELASNIL